MPDSSQSTDAARNIETAALDVLRRLKTAGFTAYFAGGCVRDRLLGRVPVDYDIATDATPDRVLALFPSAREVGRAFGVVIVDTAGQAFEVATFRKDSHYEDGRRPTRVEFCGPGEDALRRDFTINAMFYDPVEDRIIDHVGGRADLEARTIRCVGDPVVRFEEDHLRILRAVRFAATLGFTIDPATESAITSLAPRLTIISAERIRDELSRILTESQRAGQALLLLERTGILKTLLPEIQVMREQQQPPDFHPEGDVLTHTAMMLDRMPPPPRDLILALAVLLHDVGKPPSARLDGDRIRFDNHDVIGADMARIIMEKFRFPGQVIDTVVHCVRNHMRFKDAPQMRRSTLRRMVGAPTFDVEMDLHRLDCMSSHGKMDVYDFLGRYREEMRSEPVLPPPWVRGEDLLALGVTEGPEIGRWLRAAYDEQLEGRAPDRAALLEWLKNRTRRD